MAATANGGGFFVPGKDEGRSFDEEKEIVLVTMDKALSMCQDMGIPVDRSFEYFLIFAEKVLSRLGIALTKKGLEERDVDYLKPASRFMMIAESIRAIQYHGMDANMNQLGAMMLIVDDLSDQFEKKTQNIDPKELSRKALERIAEMMKEMEK